MPARLGRRYVRPILYRNPYEPPGTTYNDSVSGTIALSGPRTESHSKDEGTKTGTIGLSGARTETHAHSSTPAGTIPLNGTPGESFEPPGGTADITRPRQGYGT